MSVVEDTRKAVQDFLAPELREFKARLETIERRVDSLERHMNDRFDMAERSANTRHEAVVLMFQAAFKLAEVERRLGTLEGEKKTISQ